MLFILEQRLQAQNIAGEKALRVLTDVIGSMYSDKFLNELFKPQRIYSNTSTRQIFDRLAHSSIMRLNGSSMDKLYDLMTMGCKHQVLNCASAPDLLQVSLNHIDALRQLVVKHAQTVKLLDKATQRLLLTYSNMPLAEWINLRHTLCRFFQDRRVKVSLFLQEKLQGDDGCMIISHKGNLPPKAAVPGTIRYVSEGKVLSEEKVQVENSSECAVPSQYWTVHKPHIRTTTLGENLYAKTRNKPKLPDRPSPQAGSDGEERKDTEDSSEPLASSQTAKAELNMLAQMIGGSGAAPADKFSIVNLFPDSDGDEVHKRTADILVFDAGDKADLRDQLAQSLSSFEIQEAADDDSDDLLALMDSSA